ncbi:NADPH-dependent FMN reductase [Aquimarina algiphila]|uniref:NADPH-dependent FMN reductase n=1 Tax=Aquimarina algiphila TaxID=2047982 RepID=UPI0024919BF6|nr:NAD(P)H-dependent oxidoreductase [Aquimarina algiphila]
MSKRKNIVAINGSASDNSSNLKLIKHVAELMKNEFNFIFFNDLTKLPHFKTELTDHNTPERITQFRNVISNAHGILICTPEYVFSIPSRLKNAIEWCISTTAFSNKPVGLITASASGLKGHEELKLIMESIEAIFIDDTALLIQGIKGKIDQKGNILDEKTKIEIENFVISFHELIGNTNS